MTTLRADSSTWLGRTVELLPATGAVAAALAAQRAPAALASPVSCPGLSEFLVVLTLRGDSAMRVGDVLATFSAVSLALLVGALYWVARRLGASRLAAAAVAAAAGSSAAFQPALAAPHALALALALGALASLVRLRDNGSTRAMTIVAGWLAATAAAVPPLAGPLAAVALLAGLVAPARRALPAAAAAALVVAAAAATTLAVPALDNASLGSRLACLVPAAGPSRDMLAGAIVTPASPYALGLAALGLFTLAAHWKQRLAPVFLVFALLPIVAAPASAADATRLFAPTMAALWGTAAVGMEVLRRESGTTRTGVAAGLALTLLLPGLELARRVAPLAPDAVPAGHASLSRERMTSILNALPDAAVLAVDDATSDLTLRATSSRLRAEKRTQVVTRDAETLRSLASVRAVHLFPAAARELQHRGFELGSLPAADLRGVAAISTVRSCDPLGRRWRAVEAPRSGSFAFVAGNERARGPIVVYLGSDARINAHPRGWPGFTSRGFATSEFDASSDDARSERNDNLNADAVPDATWHQLPHVQRLELWRTPDAPAHLIIGTDHAPTHAIARWGSGVVEPIALCPSIPFEGGKLD